MVKRVKKIKEVLPKYEIFQILNHQCPQRNMYHVSSEMLNHFYI